MTKPGRLAAPAQRSNKAMEKRMHQNLPHYQPISIPSEGPEEVVIKRGMNPRQKLAVLALDLLMLIELAVAMAWASKYPDSFTPTFMKTFFLMLVPTLVADYLVIRSLKHVEHRPA
jgi:hypothetical protein